MKKLCILGITLLFVGCSRQEQAPREVLAKLDAIQKDLMAKRSEAPRWAFANKREIEAAVFQWTREKTEEINKRDAVSPETEEKIRAYESLRSELTRKQVETMRLRVPGAGFPHAAPPDKDYEDLSNRVAQARAPIADILERRSRQTSQLKDQFPTDKLVAEYAKGRFELVVDSSDQVFQRSAVIYRTTGEVMDITEGVIRLFKEKAKP